MSEIKKPVITKEQADALILLQADITDSAILEFYVGDSLAVRDPRNRCLYDLDILTLAAALINGYEVEKTPEEKIREYYEEAQRRCKARSETGDIEGLRYNAGRGYGVVDTLDILGIKIEGVNA
ncbi:hypothetical protein P4284_23005 [Bacillus swezeyi]|uniref:hypothetical protein n=1 Tax=Bacillus swezeyi TaxID=1925020 RepID=UPI002E1BEBEB|nr:hypothetical protein [Bacillus swezeyi]